MRSKVAAMKTRPEAVQMEPPLVWVPVFGMPRFLSSGNSPLTTRHLKSP